MKNKYLCLLFLLFSLLSMSAHAQIKVEGNVFDENDIPLIGVSVVTEGGKTGAITDVNGHFSIMVPNANAHLTFSYVGYITQKLPLKGKKLLKVIMKEDANLLDEVVVVGYGTQKKINVTGAIAQVDNKELKIGFELPRRPVFGIMGFALLLNIILPIKGNYKHINRI